MTETVEQLSFLQLVLACGAVLGGLMVIFAAAGFALERKFGKTRRVWAIPLADGQLRWELIGNVRFLLMGAFAFAALLQAVPFAEESASSIAITFGFCWFGFEVYYWGLHRAMHLPLFYRFHRYHHDSRVTTPLTGYSMSTVESAGWLVGLTAVPFLLTLMTPLSLTGFLLYHALYQVPGNIIGHANMDFFPAAAHKPMNSWISHPTVYHALHHARFNNHYSFGSSFMDRLLGTEWADWPELHERVINGEPMCKLSVRGAEGTTN